MNTTRYSLRLLWSEEDQAFLATVPELPGCMADGKTPEEAIQNVQVVISEWIETANALGREIPVPIDAASAAMMEARFKSSIQEHIEREARSAVNRILQDVTNEDVALRYKRGYSLSSLTRKKRLSRWQWWIGVSVL